MYRCRQCICEQGYLNPCGNGWGNFPCKQREHFPKLTAVFGQGHFQRSETIYATRIYWASAMLLPLCLLLKMQKHKLQSLPLRRLLHDPYSEAEWWQHITRSRIWISKKVIINYYIILLQGSLKNKESDFYLLSSLSLKSWIMTLQRYLNNRKEGSTEC